ncbi:ABC transporter ATP-binding protein [Gryllotalpicola protaetiae]|uniref:ABC transporter ATP-binding protein n=1 Tax=Gryllotalpicola protaetiae TaxID=2419771 RepID=UPI001C65DE7E|nr:ATP-binding cassette domain-containing protein [Gryllotalpicola protaetiae]
MRAEHLSLRYPGGKQAVSDVSLSISAGTTLGIVGESGSGKSTTAKMILRLLKPAAGGSVVFDGVELTSLPQRSLKRIRRRLQVIPQNPQASFNPRMTVGASVAFNLRVHGATRSVAWDRAAHMLDRVGIPAAYAHRFPRELSGGQLQRCAIARALITEPELVVCDEAVSALDKSVQAQVLNLLAHIQAESGIAYLFVSHDLAVVEHVADHVLVMQHGRVVEEGTAAQIWSAPSQPYTRSLLDAAPDRLLARKPTPSTHAATAWKAPLD